MAAAWAPTPAQVKALMPARVNGLPFGVDTTPTEAEVLEIVDQVVVEIRSEVGSFDPTKVTNPTAPEDEQMTLGDIARWAAQLGAAYYVEQGFWPEQNETAGEDSPAGRFFTRYNEQRARLASMIEELADTNSSFAGSIETPLGHQGCYVPDVPRLPWRAR